ncbi:MAG: hypothetical protein IKZ84_05010, partial [Victivallales bacterium]|nr:hypothetical protein [Victivallales bacterium]
PLVMLHPAFFSVDERQKIYAAADGNIVEIGMGGKEETFNFKLLMNGVCQKERHAPLGDVYRQNDVYSWLDELPERRPVGDFLTDAASAVNDAFSIMWAEMDAENFRLWGYGASDGLFHLFISNRKHTYAWARILLKKRAVFGQLLSGGFVMPPVMENIAEGGTRLQFKLPPMGTVGMTLKI